MSGMIRYSSRICGQGWNGLVSCSRITQNWKKMSFVLYNYAPGDSGRRSEVSATHFPRHR